MKDLYYIQDKATEETLGYVIADGEHAARLEFSVNTPSHNSDEVVAKL